MPVLCDHPVSTHDQRPSRPTHPRTGGAGELSPGMASTSFRSGRRPADPGATSGGSASGGLDEGAPSAALAVAHVRPPTHIPQMTPMLLPPSPRRAFECQCGRPIFFRNDVCLHCATPLGYDPLRVLLRPLQPGDAEDTWRSMPVGGEDSAALSTLRESWNGRRVQLARPDR